MVVDERCIKQREIKDVKNIGRESWQAEMKKGVDSMK